MRHHQLLPRPQHGDPEVPALPLDEYTKSPSQRIGGWSGEKQATFLRAIAEGATVGQACRLVGLTQQSAYAFRLSARGAHFALGWEAALLHARNCLADTLMERALHGTVETITRSDGSEVERHRIDNRLGMAMLTRLDRMADKAAKEATHAAARLVAQEFEAYIDLVARDAGPARADSWLRTHTDLAGPLADLDPAARAHWSGADWARAEAAGLVEIAPAPARADHQAIQDFAPAGAAWPAGEEPVWWDGDDEKWHTRFPPPADFHGEEDGAYGDDEYSRELTAEEEHLVEAPYRARLAARRKVEGAARDRWFALLAAPETDDGAAIFSHAAP